MEKINKQIRENQLSAVDRRIFLKSAGLGLMGVAGIGLLPLPIESSKGYVVKRTKEERLKQIASNSWAILPLFKGRVNPERPERPETVQLKKKYGEITLLDFPQFTKDHFPGVTAMDIRSSVFGDVTDDSMFTRVERNGQTRFGFFDPSTPSSKRYLDLLVTKMVSTGVKAVHISNNAPVAISTASDNAAGLSEEARREGVRVAKIWLDAARQTGVQSMRINTGGPQILPQSVVQGGYPRNLEIVPYLKNAIESFKEMADYGGKVGVKVTIENHWGLAANPMNIIIILNEVNSPFLEASPDFSNWEHDYLLYNGLEILIPYAKSMCHAKRWTRYPDVDINRCVQILNKAGYKGYISMEYEGGGDPLAGALKLMDDVVEALI
jgi:sugar phosphate isomerase/epimerase